MAKVTSKLQVTLPKLLAARYGLRPGDDIEWAAGGDSIRIMPVRPGRGRLDVEARLRLFDEATQRQERRQADPQAAPAGSDRGWRREELYERGGLIDTNVLVYRFDPRFPDKQATATELLRRGVQDDTLRLPHQAVVEFVAAVTRPVAGGSPLLSRRDAVREAEDLLRQFVVLYPTESLVRTAIRGWAAYQFAWFDAHLWAYAEEYGLDEIVSEDFEHDRLYGTVRAVNPFR